LQELSSGDMFVALVSSANCTCFILKLANIII